MFDMLDAGILSIIVSLIAVIAAVATSKAERSMRKNLAQTQTQKSRKIREKLTPLRPVPTLFEAVQINRYRERMIASQLMNNSRILPGSGKTHTLSVIATVAATKTPMPTVLGQVGDTFS